MDNSAAIESRRTTANSSVLSVSSLSDSAVSGNRTALGSLNNASLERTQLERQMVQMNADELQAEVRRALAKLTKTSPLDKLPPPHSKGHTHGEGVPLSSSLRHEPIKCSTCAAPLSAPVMSCSLRGHPHCGACVRLLGGRHRCHTCVPLAHVVSAATTAHNRSAASMNDSLFPTETTLRMLSAGTGASGSVCGDTSDGAVAVIESWVDPLVRDLRLETKLQASS